MTTGPIQIHLIRHGEVHNPNRILYGRLPRFRLNQNGRRQARAAGAHLDGCPIDALFSSPMLRARQTAREIIRYHPHLTLRISEMINEVRTSFEGRPGAEIDARDGDVYSGGDGGEQPQDIVDRTRRFILRAGRPHPGGQVAAVTHGDVITFMVLWARGFDPTPRNKNRLLQAGYPVAYPAHASITTLTYRGISAEEKPDISYTVPGADDPTTS
jgi:broad specificity phosphatase PhoE